MSNAAKQNINPESKPKWRLLNKARLYEHLRNNNAQKNLSEDVLRIAKKPCKAS